MLARYRLATTAHGAVQSAPWSPLIPLAVSFSLLVPRAELRVPLLYASQPRPLHSGSSRALLCNAFAPLE